MHWAATPAIDRVLEEARKATDPEEQKALYEESQVMAADQVPARICSQPDSQGSNEKER